MADNRIGAVRRTDVHVSIAPHREHGALNELYLRLGYHGGIAHDDVVFVAHVDGEPVGLVRRSVESGLLMLRGAATDGSACPFRSTALSDLPR